MENPILLCTRLKEHHKRSFKAIKGSVVRKCSECGEKVFIAPTSIKILLADGHNLESVTLVCTDCFEPDEPLNVQPIRQEQIDELEENYGKGDTYH